MVRYIRFDLDHVTATATLMTGNQEFAMTPESYEAIKSLVRYSPWTRANHVWAKVSTRNFKGATKAQFSRFLHDWYRHEGLWLCQGTVTRLFRLPNNRMRVTLYYRLLKHI